MCVCVCFLKLITAGNSDSTATGIMCWLFLKDVAVHCLGRCFESNFAQLPVSTVLKAEGEFHELILVKSTYLEIVCLNSGIGG